MYIKVNHNEDEHVKNVTVSMPLNDEQIALVVTVKMSHLYWYDVRRVWKKENVEGRHWGFHVSDNTNIKSVVVNIFPETAEDYAIYNATTVAAVTYGEDEIIVHLVKRDKIPTTPIMAWNLGDPKHPSARPEVVHSSSRHFKRFESATENIPVAKTK